MLNIDLAKLQEEQKILDAHVEENHPRLENENRLLKKCMAAVVELSETLQETKSFKFWSNKPPSDREVVLGEYVDVLHFALSVCIEADVDVTTLTIEDMGDKDINELARDIVMTTCFISYGFSMHDNLFKVLLKLGEQYGFSGEEIEAAYMVKSKINHSRQLSGY